MLPSHFGNCTYRELRSGRANDLALRRGSLWAVACSAELGALRGRLDVGRIIAEYPRESNLDATDLSLGCDLSGPIHT